MLTRREALGALGAVTVLAGCNPIAARIRRRADVTAFAPPDVDVTPGVRLFARAGFGHRPGDLQAYARDGHAATVERLLQADAAEDPALVLQLNRLDVFRVNDMELLVLPENEVIRQLQTAAVLRAVYGANPLLERMSDFWTNHFSIYARKGRSAFRKGSDESEVVRKHALGKFPEMLVASAKSPAMLAFLDGRQNVKGAPNENYARELMELHTLGVDGGYTQKDIQEVARCFTGFILETRFLGGFLETQQYRRVGGLYFDPERHDDGEKIVLGHRIPAGGGERDADLVLNILARHPATARYLARKLVLQFIGESNASLEAEVAAQYGKTGGDIRAMLRPILLSPDLVKGPPILRRPLDYLASGLRAMDAETDGGVPLIRHLGTMGQPLYEWPMPDGFPLDAATWSGAMLARWNYAFALGSGSIERTSVPVGGKSADTILGAIYGRRPGERDRALRTAMHKSSPGEALSLALSAPEYQWR